MVGEALGIDAEALLSSEEDHVHVLEAEEFGMAALDQEAAEEEGMLSEASVYGLTLAMSDWALAALAEVELVVRFQ